jgi:formyltetrahydrofolate-dependent phosphoribosylglycinamide formyltransferase
MTAGPPGGSGAGPPRRARLAVLVSGNGSNLAAVLDACAGGRLNASVEVVVSNRRAAYALERARAAGVAAEYLALRPHLDAGRSRVDYDAVLADLVAGYRPDWVVLAGWMHVLSTAFLHRFPGRVVNLHPALPGEFPGAHAIDDAWAAFERGEVHRTGVMVHLVPDEGVDDGPVVSTAEVPILPGDTRDALEARVHTVEHDLLVTSLSQLIAHGPLAAVDPAAGAAPASSAADRSAVERPVPTERPVPAERPVPSPAAPGGAR